MALNDLAARVLKAVQGDKAAIKKLSDALISRDPARIRQVFSEVASIDITEAEAREVINGLGSDAEQALAYYT